MAALVSEENEEPVIINADPESGRYIIVFDPLDGSSNIDVNVNVGTIFSILKRVPGQPIEAAILQPGAKQVAAGYVVYGPSTMLVYTSGDGVYLIDDHPVVRSGIANRLSCHGISGFSGVSSHSRAAPSHAVATACVATSSNACERRLWPSRSECPVAV